MKQLSLKDFAAISLALVSTLSALPAGAAHAAHAAEIPAGKSDTLPTVAAKTTGLERRAGLLPVYMDRQHGKIWLEVPSPAGKPDGEVGSYLYVEGIVTGLGSNPVGLDRGQLGNGRILTLRRVGGGSFWRRRTLGSGR